VFFLEVLNFFLHVQIGCFKLLYLHVKTADLGVLNVDFCHIFHPKVVSLAQSLLILQEFPLQFKVHLLESLQLI